MGELESAAAQILSSRKQSRQISNIPLRADAPIFDPGARLPATPENQMQGKIGAELFPLVQRQVEEDTGMPLGFAPYIVQKATGMLLELPEDELLPLLSN